MTYDPPIEDGEWIEPLLRGFKWACCDCGLIHTVDFRIKDGVLEFRVFRDNKATGQRRRWRKKRK